jgi:hypothetical protein
MTKQANKPRRSAHQTQWAAQFAVASELCKQGYEVALTMGNQPVFDLMVISPSLVYSPKSEIVAQKSDW